MKTAYGDARQSVFRQKARHRSEPIRDPASLKQPYCMYGMVVGYHTTTTPTDGAGGDVSCVVIVCCVILSLRRG
jgi:hypothetical protein